MIRRSHRSTVAGFTLGEMIVAVGASSAVAVAAFLVLNSGLILYAKNTAENLAHDSSRIAVNRLVHSIHESVSIPQLGHIVAGNLAANPGAPTGSWTPYGTNLTFYADAGSGPTAGISFQSMGKPGDPNGGPFNLFNDPGQPDLIKVDSGNSVPEEGMRLIIPYYGLESTITKAVVDPNANHYNIWTAGGIESRIKTKNNSYYICYYTSRWGYVVENGQLHLYSSSKPPTGVTWPVTIVRNIVSVTPFTQPSSQYVGINLQTQDFHYTNRNFKCVNTLLAGSVPYRAQLCVTQ